MKTLLISLLIALLATSALRAADDAKIPPPEAQAKAVLDKSPRHGEYVDVPAPNGKTLKAFVVYPESKDKAPVVIVIHEIFGLSDWIKSVADQLAADGFIAIAPDLLTGMGPGGGGTESITDRQQVTKMVSGLNPAEVMKNLDAVRDYGLKLPAANGKSASIGFCWGGARSFEYAAAQPELGAAIVYYGTSPSDPKAYEKINAAVQGHYGGNDARVNATIPTAEANMKKLGKIYEPHIYEGAGHGFLRAQAQSDANAKAAKEAWPLTITFLKEHTK